MWNLFEYTDQHGDTVRVDTSFGALFLRAIGKDCSGNAPSGTEVHAASALPAGAVEDLHAVLGQWLRRNGHATEPAAPEPATHVDTTVTADDVRRIARDELIKILDARGEHIREITQDEFARHVTELLEAARTEARQEVRNVFTRVIEMGADQ